jgi:vacuolar iron transporter family protein
MAAPGRPPAETGTAASAASGSGAASVPGPVAQPPGDGGPEINHQHRDVSGGWLRPAVFGAMDGLVTNVSLIAGVGGARLSSHNIILTGLAGLSAGAFSMAAGEFVSVSSQNELVQSEVEKERIELETNPADEQAELAALYKMRGGASLVTFAIGALIPLLPYLLGFSSLAAAVILAAVAAFVGGGIVARVTARPFLRGAVRQLVLAAVAAALTYLIGSLVSGSA